jgi:type IV secretory pathway VirJ component
MALPTAICRTRSIAAFTSAANKDGRDHVEALKKVHAEIEIRDADDDAQTTLSDTLDDLIDASGSANNPLGLPLAILDAKPALRYDGGDLFRRRRLARYRQGGRRHRCRSKASRSSASIRSITSGLSASRRRRRTISSKIIELYRKQWKVKHVLLVGYSFGADVVPAAFSAPEAGAQKRGCADVAAVALPRG